MESGGYQKGDERILGDGAFVIEVLAHAKEQLHKKYRLNAEGYNLEKLIDRVAEITQLTPKEIMDGVRAKKRTDARSIFRFWAKEELRIKQRRLADILNLTQSAISYAVRRGKILVENNSYSIFDH